MAIRKYWEEYDLGQVLVTPAITITDAHLVEWAGLTLDFYPLHMDEPYAKTTMMGGRIAHGPLTFALSVGLMAQREFMNYDPIIAWLGSEVKATKPVRPGDTIHVEAEIVEKRETKRADRGIQKWLYRIMNQDGEVVMENMMTFMMYRKIEGQE